MQTARYPTQSRLLLLPVLLVIGLITTYLWVLNRGYDVTDEGFYLLGFAYPKEYGASFTSFHLLIGKILPVQYVSILGYRAASLLAALFSASIFSWSLWRWSAAKLGTALHWAYTLPLFILANMLQYSIAPRVINYNTFNSLTISVFASSVLYYLTAPGRRALIILAFGSLWMGLDLFVKISSSGLVLGSGLGILLLSTESTPASGVGKRIVHLLLAIATGIAAAITLFSLFILPLSQWYQGFQHDATLLLNGPYKYDAVLPRYIGAAYPIVRTLVYPFLPLAACAAGWVYYQGRGINKFWQHCLILFVILGVIVFKSWETSLYTSSNFNNGRSSVWLLGALLIGLAMLLAAQWRYSKRFWPEGRWRTWLVPVWLLALPLLAAFGTYNNIFNNALYDAMYWAGALVVLFELMPTPVQGLRGASLALLALPALALTEQTAYGLLLVPYLQAQNMFRQDTPVVIASALRPCELLVDALLANYIQEIRGAMREAGFRAGGPVIAIYDMPGLVYALDGVSPGSQWYFGTQDFRNCDALAKTRQDLTAAFLLVNQKPSPEFVACLANQGMHFPKDYELIHRAMSPFKKDVWHYAYADTMLIFKPLPRSDVIEKK